MIKAAASRTVPHGKAYKKTAKKKRGKSLPRKAETAAAKTQPHIYKAKQRSKKAVLPARAALPSSAEAAHLPAISAPALPVTRAAAKMQASEKQRGEMTQAKTEPASFRRELLALLPGLRAFAVSLCGRADRADDLLQDTIMRAWAKQESFTMGTNMKAWLFTILRNEFYSEIRRRGREVQDSDGFFADHIAVPPEQYGSLDLQDFKQALDKLPPDQKEAIVLIGASGFSYEEAADICKCAIGTIKSRVSRARARLQELLGISGESDCVSAPPPPPHSL